MALFLGCCFLLVDGPKARQRIQWSSWCQWFRPASWAVFASENWLNGLESPRKITSHSENIWKASPDVQHPNTRKKKKRAKTGVSCSLPEILSKVSFLLRSWFFLRFQRRPWWLHFGSVCGSSLLASCSLKCLRTTPHQMLS